jgi:hypothetical protein
MKRLGFAAVLTLILGFSTLGNAAPLPLVNNGNGFIYDQNLGITWYDFTYNGPSNTGATWSQAKDWITGLNNAKLGGVTDNGWRLPINLPVNGSSTYSYGYSLDGSTDWGYNIGATGTIYAGSKASEMAYLYFTELGNIAYFGVNGNYPQSGWGLKNTGFFTNLQPQEGFYWSGTEFGADTQRAWVFELFDGGQGYMPKSNTIYALAVHSGDVGAPVPIPGAILLFAPGLAGLAAIRRKFRK